ncbi:MAG: hypothetical protein AAF696_09095 [Bacteroidota bacterium]
MKVIITKQHIKAAKLSEGRLTPIEVALNDMDCFQEINMKTEEETGKTTLELDGMKMDLPKKAQQALNTYMEEGEMKPFNFDLEMGDEIFVGEDLLMESFEDSLHLDMDLDFF